MLLSDHVMHILYQRSGAAMDDIERIARRIKLHDMRVLIAVIEAGSMHKVAARLGASQPTISRAIADLEHSIGVRLVERSPRGIQPTQYASLSFAGASASRSDGRDGVRLCA
jgi:molybdenum-dependent DNA-binding transcriptional regulator ModE